MKLVKFFQLILLVFVVISCNNIKSKTQKDSILSYEIFCNDNCSDELCQKWKAPHKDSIFRFIERFEKIDNYTWNQCFGHFQCGVKGTLKYQNILYDYYLNAGGWLTLSANGTTQFFGSKQQKDTLNNFISVFYCDDMLKEKTQNDSLFYSLSEKYNSSRYFDFLLNKNADLQQEIANIYDKNLQNIIYEEEVLETDLVLSKFILDDFSEYDFVVKNEKIIFKNALSISKTKHYFEYKDWDNNQQKDLIEYTEQCEAGCQSYRKEMSIYHVMKDTILLKMQLPVKERICYDNITQITDYAYQVKNKMLYIKKTSGSRTNCHSDQIQKIDSISQKTKVID